MVWYTNKLSTIKACLSDSLCKQKDRRNLGISYYYDRVRYKSIETEAFQKCGFIPIRNFHSKKSREMVMSTPSNNASVCYPKKCPWIVVGNNACKVDKR